MRFNFRLDRLDSHAHITLFINGGNCGRLVCRPEEVGGLTAAIWAGLTTPNEIEWTGDGWENIDHYNQSEES